MRQKLEIRMIDTNESTNKHVKTGVRKLRKFTNEMIRLNRECQTASISKKKKDK